MSLQEQRKTSGKYTKRHYGLQIISALQKKSYKTFL